MKRYLIILLFVIDAVVALGQGFPGTDSLRTFNNKYITTNPATAFTNRRLNILLAGMIDWIDSARAGEGGIIGVDTISVLNDSTLRYRDNGAWRNLVLKGVYDHRRKVDTVYKTNDTTLAFTVNGSQRTLIFPGRINFVDSIYRKAGQDSIFYRRNGVEFAIKDSTGGGGGGSGNDNENIGTGFPWLVFATQQIKRVANSNTILWDSTSTTNSLTAKVDTSAMATQHDLTLLALGITQLTGDVTAGPGSGTQAATIANSAVTTSKIADNNVTTDKIAANAVTTAKIADNNVTTAKINDGAVTTNKINDDAVTDAKLRESAGTSVIGKATSGTGNPADIVASTNNRVLKRNASGNLAFEQITDDDVSSVDYSKLTNPPATVPGLYFAPAQSYNQSFTVMAIGIARPNNAWGNGVLIGWELLATSDHSYSFFDSVYGSASTSRLILRYPNVRQVLSLTMTPDEAFAQACTIGGPSVGLTTAEAPVYRPITLGITLRGAGTNTWAEVSGSGLQSFFDESTVNGTTGLTGINIATPAGTVVWGTDYNAINLTYMGPNNYHIKRHYSGLGIHNMGFSLRDEFDNPVLLPTSSDEVLISGAGITSTTVNMRTYNSTNTFMGTLTNWWCIGTFEAWIVAAPVSTSSIQVRWQENYPSATSYKILRSTSQYGTYTQVFSGTGGTYLDTGLSTGTLYFYKMYAVVGGVDTEVSYFRTNTY